MSNTNPSEETVHHKVTICTQRLRELAKRAIDVQNACNLSGVSGAFTAAVLELRVVGEMLNCLSHDWVNNHPITRAWVDKLASLTGIQSIGDDRAVAAHSWCSAVVRGKQDPLQVPEP